MSIKSEESRTLILAPFGKDSVHLSKVLTAEKLACVVCGNPNELAHELKNGAGAVLTTDEVLSSPESEVFLDVLRTQPSWSAIPVLAFYSDSGTINRFEKEVKSPVREFVDITFLQKPVSRAILISSLKAALRDRSRQYRIRDLLLNAEEAKAIAQDASQMKSQFLANMSHEIRTPLGAITGFLELIKNGDSSRDEIVEYISIVDRNSVQLMRLIDDILDLSKVEAGKMEIEKVDLSLGELLFDFAALMGFKAREKGVLFDLHLATPMPARVSSDPTRIRQVLTNIVGNAIKFTDRGRVQLVCSYTGNELKFQVTDTGRGITKTQAEKLFQPFVQADSSTTRTFGGTGLGLVLSKRICQLMGGDLFLENSEINVGSTFVAKLVMDQIPGTEWLGKSEIAVSVQTNNLGNERPLKDMRVLLVDDSPDNRALFTITLKKLGAKVDVATNGKEAVAQAAGNGYDVILMDVQMPVMDGHEATRKLRSVGTQTPIIALTAHAMNEERERTMKSGFTDFLSKPLRREALVQALIKYGMKSDSAASINQ